MDLEERLVASCVAAEVDGVLETISSGVCLNLAVCLKPGDTTTETTALLEAIALENTKVSLCICQLLLLNGADPNLGVSGVRPLHVAARLGRGDHTTLLLESGARTHFKDHEGNTALSIAEERNFDNVVNILRGRKGDVTIRFNRYIFEEDGEEKENAESNTAHFLRQVEKIFADDIAGTPSTAHGRLSPISEDIAEVASRLEEIGFRTPNIYSARARTAERSLQGLSKNDGYREKVEKYLDNLEEGETITVSDDKVVPETPVRKEKSYLRPTASSTLKRRLLLDTSAAPAAAAASPRSRQTAALTPGKQTNPKAVNSMRCRTPLEPKTSKRRVLHESNCRTDEAGRGESQLGVPPPDTPSKFSTLESVASKHSSRSSLAVSLANSSNISVSEEYIIQDQHTGLVLLEKRLPSLLGLAMQDEALLNQLEEEAELPTDKSNNFSLGSMSDYSTGRIRRELGKFGEALDGPITTDTKRAYLLRLKKLRLGLVVPANHLDSKFPVPLAKSLKDISSITKSWECMWKLDDEMSCRFSSIDPKVAEGINYLTRESVCKSSFNYLLLDPRKSQNLPYKVFSWADQDLWRTFIDSIFYIGKGTRSRPFQHLYDACKTKVPRKNREKVQTILDIWGSGYGVVSIQVFNNSIGVEGLTREAAMIDAIGLDNLSNVRPGDYYGPAASWSAEQKLLLGTFLLYRAFKIFLQEGERQIRPVDLKLKI